MILWVFDSRVDIETWTCLGEIAVIARPDLCIRHKLTTCSIRTAVIWAMLVSAARISICTFRTNVSVDSKDQPLGLE